MAAKYQAAQSTDGKVKNGSMEHAVQWEHQAKSAEVMEACSFSVEASTDQLRGLICKNQHGYTGGKGLMKISTRLADCKARYRCKTRKEKKAGTKDLSLAQAGSTRQTRVRKVTTWISSIHKGAK